MAYRVYIGKFGVYLPDSFLTQDAAETAGNDTRFGYTVENESGYLVAVKGKLSGIIRIPEKNATIELTAQKA